MTIRERGRGEIDKQIDRIKDKNNYSKLEIYRNKNMMIKRLTETERERENGERKMIRKKGKQNR